MATLTDAGLTTQRLEEVAELVKRAGADAVRLRIVERFLSEVERRLLKKSPVIFDIERVRTALHILRTLTDEDDVDQCLEAEFRLDQEFHLWTTLIEDRDRSIETYHFRRLCDSAPEPLDDEIYIALASFYREIDFSPSSLSKFDLSVTRLFTRTSRRGRRDVRGPRSETISRLNQLFPSAADARRSHVDIEYAVEAIDGFTDEALHLGSFEDLVRSNIFDRYRVFKRELASLFFEPEIVAAAIECNVAVGNVFDNLLLSADEQLSARLTVDVDLPAALHDASPEARTHIDELFKVFFGDAESKQAPEISGDVDYLGKLLALSTARSADRQTVESSLHEMSVQDRLAPFLRTLTEAKPDVDLLLKQMKHSESLNTADVNDFLFAADGSPDILCRRALGLILWSQVFRDSELKKQKALNENIQSEVTALLYKAEHFAVSLQSHIDAADALNENRLRAVLNCLLDSRLRLERSIVRFTNKKLVTANQISNEDRASAPQPSVQNPKHRKRARSLSRWLVIMFILAAVIAGVFYILNQEFGGGVSSTKIADEIDVRTLPQNEFMRSAYRHERTLFITARDTWSRRPAEEREQTLRGILDEPGRFRFQTIVVMSEGGDVLANISRNGVFLDYGDPNTGTNPSSK